MFTCCLFKSARSIHGDTITCLEGICSVLRRHQQRIYRILVASFEGPQSMFQGSAQRVLVVLRSVFRGTSNVLGQSSPNVPTDANNKFLTMLAARFRDICSGHLGDDRKEPYESVPKDLSGEGRTRLGIAE